MRLALLSLFFGIFTVVRVLAGNDSLKTRNYSGPTRFHSFCGGYGGIIAHNPPVKHLAQSHPWNVGYEYCWIDDKSEWSESFRFPKSGILVQYFDYQSPKVLGSSFSGTIFLEPTLFKNFSYRLGTGLVYNTNPFDLETNTTNLMLGSEWALVMHGQVNYLFRITSKIGFRAGIGITHFSNGAFEVPNAGINNFHLSFAAMRMSEPRKILGHSDSISRPGNWSKGFSASLSSSLGLVEKFPVDGPKYFVFQAHGRLNYRKGRKSGFLFGGDFMYNDSYQATINESPKFGTKEGRIGLVAGHELHISMVSLISEFGYYVFKDQVVNPNLYQRYGLRFYFHPNFHSALYLKVHGSKAECFEWVLGCHLWRQKKS